MPPLITATTAAPNVQPIRARSSRWLSGGFGNRVAIGRRSRAAGLADSRAPAIRRSPVSGASSRIVLRLARDEVLPTNPSSARSGVGARPAAAALLVLLAPPVTAPAAQPPVLLDAAASRARPPGHEAETLLDVPRPARSPHEGSTSGGSDNRRLAAREILQGCEPTLADVASGPALVEYLLSIPRATCINILFNRSDELVVAAFREERVIHVMDMAAKRASTYDGRDPGALSNLFYFARAAFFTEGYRDDLLFSPDVSQATVHAIDQFVGNPRFGDIRPAHADAVWEVFVVMDSVSHGYRARYLPLLRNWLADFDSRHAAHREFLGAANAIMYWLSRGHYDPAFVEAAGSDTALIEALSRLALPSSPLDAPGLDEADRDQRRLLTGNAAAELARFLDYPDAPVAPAVEDGVRRILDQYDIHGESGRIWMAVVETVHATGSCAAYDLCDVRDEIARDVLSIVHPCSDSVVIRAQGMTPRGLTSACDDISRVEMFFHERLGTDREPLPGDLNATLEIVVYDDWDNYDQYSGFLFGHSTDNGGIYLEGDPADPANVARFFAYLADWLPGTPVWNLRHEYVHYLDGRFNLAGGFSDYRVFSHKTIWWQEGLAEYVSNFGGTSRLVEDYLQGAVSPLHEIFDIVDYQDRTLYPESHLAMWFFFERRLADTYDFRRFFRGGDYDGYLRFLDGSIGDRHDGEFREWISERTVLGATTE